MFDRVLNKRLDDVWQLFEVNLFVPNAPFCLSPENMMFLEGREKVHWEQMG